MSRESSRSIRKWSLTIVVLTVCVILVGCVSYQKVTDPASGNVYYATKVKKQRGGAVTFTDKRTGAEVTLQSSEIQKISGKEFKEAVKTD